MNHITFEIFSRGLLRIRYYFRIRAANGEIVAQSESYTRKAAALETVGLLKESSFSAEIVDTTLDD